MGSTAKERFLGMAGLAKKAGAVVSGTQNVTDALKARKAAIVFMASGISASTEKRLRDRTAFYGVKLIALPIDGDELGAALGRPSTVAAFAVTDENMAQAVENKAVLFIKENEENK